MGNHKILLSLRSYGCESAKWRPYILCIFHLFYMLTCLKRSRAWCALCTRVSMYLACLHACRASQNGLLGVLLKMACLASFKKGMLVVLHKLVPLMCLEGLKLVKYFLDVFKHGTRNCGLY